ncbi:carboxypeptidase-like regulatory domain-containing protein [Pedobacter sp. MC2016-14]|uniref:TonB-dependent receptor n=1 Tax=Pedobacter sp. MC2016-14 TaxID=2897327 RepID=UPI001E57DC4C|nr:TonB-dependent receptor [Pedobacter sp. MC2016-14]MCD0488395.1 carboxypeptidase-like regulatory domain-containing protein [Pedobacter sp. MC2016-14]
MLYRKFLLLILLITFSVSAFAQNTAVISGNIKDENEGIANASVLLKGTKLGTTSNAQGNYQLNNLPAGTYILVISSLGYIKETKSIVIKIGQTLHVNFSLKKDLQQLHDVNINGKTKTQEIKESGFAVNAIDTKKFANSTADLNQVLNRSTGVRIREQGGLGSDFKFSINGLSGKQVKFFIDGIRTEVMGSAMSLNNIPVNLAERLEVYKGVVPVQLGADAMGGAVNVVTNQQVTNYLDLSHSYGSFNTHRSSLTAQYADKKTGLVLKGGGFFNYSDNNYMMRGVDYLRDAIKNGKEITDPNNAEFIKGDFKRFHDAYQSAMGQVELGVVNKKWADVLFAGFGYNQVEQELQTGFDQNVVYGNVTRKSKAFNGSLRYKKDNIFVQGLNLSVFASQSKDILKTADTLMRQYYWDGAWQNKGVYELGNSVKTINNITRPRIYGRANLSYTISQGHSVNFNYTIDRLKNETYNELFTNKDGMPGRLDKQILGLAYQQELLNKTLVNTFFGKLYHLGLERNKYISNVLTQLDTTFSNYGYGVASRYKLAKDLGIKASYEHAYRLQEAEEMFGDGLLVQSNPDLRPESSDNINLGIYYSFQLREHKFFVEASGFYRNAVDFIFTVPDERSKLFKNENKSNVRITGFESEARYAYADLMSLNLNVTYQNAVNTTKYANPGSTTIENTYLNKIPNQPWLFGNADFSIGKNNILGKDTRLQFNWYTQYVHWFYLTWANRGAVQGKSDVPTQYIHNAAISYSCSQGKYNIALECKNLTNILAYDNFRLQKPGRSFSVKMRYFIK